MSRRVDAVVVGAGPNGLVAAIELARAGLEVLVVEAADTPGGGVRTSELTLPGFRHDICSGVHPLAVAAPALRDLPLEQYGLEWVHAPLCVAHPLDGAPAAALARALEESEALLGEDGAVWRSLVSPFVERWDELAGDVLRPLRTPRHPFLTGRFGLQALRSATALAGARFRTPRVRALFGGLAAHGMLPLEDVATAAIGLVLGISAHVGGWPIPRGGADALTGALVRLLEANGGRVECGRRIRRIEELPRARAVLLDLTARPALEVTGRRFPGRFRRRLERIRPGAAAFKVDYALDEPIPWQDETCRRAMVVHVGGRLEEVAAAERAVAAGRAADAPFLLVSQPSLFDPTRAPPGAHTAWAYAHVPNGFAGDITDRIEARLERFAPGFRDVVRERAVLTPAWLERHNPNLTGGDINGGAPDLRQTLLRPAGRWNPYATPAEHVYLCSSATPPGGGVHGMCGLNAARAALRRSFGR
ncbi:MAG TPA: NAD(P)/FAD-dependent oxidoreductase [Longimicrobiales bacterium]|nr:NAD(P)/FAD-dependent oxidoreductase [Longimicrobiales bacterium]